jgi:hypothetical protein
MSESKARNSRVDEGREAEERFDEEFTEPNWLSIPDSVVGRFADQGLTLRWIRIMINGQDDYKNVGDRQNDGWTFVDPNDVPEMMANSRIVNEGRFEGCVVRGDVLREPIPYNDGQRQCPVDESVNGIDAHSQQLQVYCNQRKDAFL